MAKLSGAADGKVTLRAEIFFGAGLALRPLFVAGIPYIRSISSAIGLPGLGMILAAMH